MERHERYRQNALSYCVAAAKLDEDESDAFIAPVSLCAAFAIELFLKCVLLKAGKTVKEVRSYGHDLWSMWNMSELRVQRQQALLLAESCFQDLTGAGISMRPVPAPRTFDQYLKDLGQLHSSPDMALRYPTQKTLVPPISLMVCVFERLIRAEEYGDTTVRI